jgi:hypothetical protein
LGTLGSDDANKIFTTDEAGVPVLVPISNFDNSPDGFVNNNLETKVMLATQSDGQTTRNDGTEFVITDDGGVGIGTPVPDPDAALDITSAAKGLLLPRLALYATSLPNPLSAHVAGMTVYNTAETDDVTPGFYFNDGTKWIRHDMPAAKFFYAPAISINVSAIGKGFTRDLYADYVRNFQSPAIVSNGAPAVIPVFAASALYYYITDYDNTIFENISINDAGVMTYDVISTQAAATSFLNVVFVIK